MTVRTVESKLRIASEEIWRALDEAGELSHDDLAELTEHSEELILMASGWLMRRGYILIEAEFGDYRMKLREITK